MIERFDAPSETAMNSSRLKQAFYTNYSCMQRCCTPGESGHWSQYAGPDGAQRLALTAFVQR